MRSNRMPLQVFSHLDMKQQQSNFSVHYVTDLTCSINNPARLRMMRIAKNGVQIGIRNEFQNYKTMKISILMSLVQVQQGERKPHSNVRLFCFKERLLSSPDSYRDG